MSADLRRHGAAHPTPLLLVVRFSPVTHAVNVARTAGLRKPPPRKPPPRPRHRAVASACVMLPCSPCTRRHPVHDTVPPPQHAPRCSPAPLPLHQPPRRRSHSPATDRIQP